MAKFLTTCMRVAAFAGACTLAHAVPVGTLDARDDVTLGVGAVTKDSATGLEWLDLGLSASYSFDSVTVQMGVGQPFHGFRLATISEVGTLFNHSGILTLPPGADSVSGFEALQALLSPVNIDDVNAHGCSFALWGVVFGQSAGFSAPTHNTAGIQLNKFPESSSGCSGPVPGFNAFNDFASGTAFLADDVTVNFHNLSDPKTVGGFFLVRDGSTTDVPEPGTLPLIGLVGAMAWLRHLRARRQDMQNLA